MSLTVRKIQVINIQLSFQLKRRKSGRRNLDELFQIPRCTTKVLESLHKRDGCREKEQSGEEIQDSRNVRVEKVFWKL